jgi:hypothetical protein
MTTFLQMLNLSGEASNNYTLIIILFSYLFLSIISTIIGFIVPDISGIVTLSGQANWRGAALPS